MSKHWREKRSQKTNKEINLGYVCVSDEYVLDLEISVNYCRIFRVQIVHAAYHALRNMQLQRPIHLHTKPTNTNIISDLLSAASKLSRDVKKKWKKRSEETQTLRAGCNKAEPKNFARLQTTFLFIFFLFYLYVFVTQECRGIWLRHRFMNTCGYDVINNHNYFLHLVWYFCCSYQRLVKNTVISPISVHFWW